MRFEFMTANRILFGPGTLREIGSAAVSLGRRALVVTGVETSRAAPLLEQIEGQKLAYTLFTVEHEPSIPLVQAGIQAAHDSECDLVIGFGGGSAIDTGKAIAALLTNPGEIVDYLEVIGRGVPLTQAPLPYIAIPTTAGTGSEVTRNAVLTSPEHHVKVSLRSPMMLPRLAIVDPELTYSLPPHVTAYTGLDALTQLIEPYVSSRANPMIDALCREGMSRAARSLPLAYNTGDDPAAREAMSLASLFGGLALANAGLGAVHGIAGPFGGMFDAPHGATCAALLPHTMTINITALQTRAPDHPALQRYVEVAQLLTGNGKATVNDGPAWVAELCAALHIPRLRTYGLMENQFDDLIQKSLGASSMKANPITLTPDEVATILERAL